MMIILAINAAADDSGDGNCDDDEFYCDVDDAGVGDAEDDNDKF